MDRFPNVDAIKAAHAMRAQEVRASAVAAGFTRQRRRARRLRRPGSSGVGWRPGHSPETLFWA